MQAAAAKRSIIAKYDIGQRVMTTEGFTPGRIGTVIGTDSSTLSLGTCYIVQMDDYNEVKHISKVDLEAYTTSDGAILW